MDGSRPASRRKARSRRITAAVSLLGLATLVVAGALVTGELLVVAGAAVFALAGGWVALRLAWSGIVHSRFEHAVDRTELARAYRTLFAERAVEHQAFVDGMSARLSRRDRTIHDLEGSLVGIRMRAIEAEASVLTFRRRLTDAERQIASMEDLIIATRQEQAQQEAPASGPVPKSGKPPLLGHLRSGSSRDLVVPEWADMEVDPVAALVAWEEHAGHLAGRHTADEWPAQRA